MTMIKNEIRNLDAGLITTKTLTLAIRLVILMLVLTGIAYPLVLTGIGQAIFPFQSNGSLITMDGKKEVIGSILIGQEFVSPKFLHIRPAAETASGVDPHITPENAFAQIANMSKATGIPVNTIRTLVELNIERNKIENLIVFAPNYVNVLEVNMELVRQYPEVYAEYTIDRSSYGSGTNSTNIQSGES
jgi:potassium-transporting ATPase KdpC subunit